MDGAESTNALCTFSNHAWFRHVESSMHHEQWVHTFAHGNLNQNNNNVRMGFGRRTTPCVTRRNLQVISLTIMHSSNLGNVQCEQPYHHHKVFRSYMMDGNTCRH